MHHRYSKWLREQICKRVFLRVWLYKMLVKYYWADRVHVTIINWLSTQISFQVSSKTQYVVFIVIYNHMIKVWSAAIAAKYPRRLFLPNRGHGQIGSHTCSWIIYTNNRFRPSQCWFAGHQGWNVYCVQAVIMIRNNQTHHLNCKVLNVARKWRVPMPFNTTKLVKVRKQSNILTSDYGLTDWSVKQQ